MLDFEVRVGEKALTTRNFSVSFPNMGSKI